MNWTFYLFYYIDLYIRMPHEQLSCFNHYDQYGKYENRMSDIETFLKTFSLSDKTLHDGKEILQEWSDQWVFDLSFYRDMYPDLRHLSIQELENNGHLENKYVTYLHYLFVHILKIKDHLTHAWLLNEFFDLDWREVHRLCGTEIHHLLKSSFLQHKQDLNQFQIPVHWKHYCHEMQLLLNQSMSFHWESYRTKNANSLFEKICGSWYWIMRYVVENQIQYETMLPTIYIICNIHGGGTYKYINDIKSCFTKQKLNYYQIHNRQDLIHLKMSDQKILDKKEDILWINHIYNTNILPVDILELLERKTFKKILINIHDQVLFFWTKHLDPKTMYQLENIYNPKHILKLFEDTKQVLDRAHLILCPSQYSKNLILKYYPHPQRILFIPHPDQCVYHRTVRYRHYQRDNKLNLCIPHGLYYFKGERIIQSILPLLETHFRHQIHLFVYGYLSESMKEYFRTKSFTLDISIQGMYDHETFYDWIERDQIHAFLMLNDYAETYSYCFSTCINTGLPCLYSNIEGAITERIHQFNIEGMFPLPFGNPYDVHLEKDYIQCFMSFIQHYSDQKGDPPFFHKKTAMFIPSFYKSLMDQFQMTTTNFKRKYKTQFSSIQIKS